MRAFVRGIALAAGILALHSCSNALPSATSGGTVAGNGLLRIVLTTSDVVYPAGNFVALVDGDSVRVPIGTAGIVDTLIAGSHTVSFGAVNQDCISGLAAQKVAVVTGVLSTVTLAVTCPSFNVVGINVLVTTTGGEIPAAGFLFQIGPNPAVAVGANAGTTVQVVAGAYDVPPLSGLPVNCFEPAPHPAGTTTTPQRGFAIPTLTYHVTCYPRLHDRLIFVSDRGGIVSTRPDGSDLRKEPIMAATPEWALSPDASMAAWTVLGDGTSQLWAGDLIGSFKRRVATSTNAYRPQWAPDGTHLIYADHERNGVPTPGDTASVRIINLDGSGEQRVALGFEPSFSPDGTQILWTSLGNSILVGKADGSALNTVSTGPSGSLARWSPDGSQIAFQGIGGLTIMDANRTNLHLISTMFGGEPVWSPDSRQLVVTAANHLFVLNVDGSNVHQITPDGGVDLFPQWSRLP